MARICALTLRLAIVFVVAAAVFYANAHWVLRRWADLFTSEFDRRVMQRLSYAGAVMLLIAAWIAFPESWTAVAWCALGLGLALAGRRWLRKLSAELGYQASFLALASVIRVLDNQSGGHTQKYHGLTLRLITIAARRCSAVHHIALELAIRIAAAGPRSVRVFFFRTADRAVAYTWVGVFSCSPCWPGTNCGRWAWPMPGWSVGWCCWNSG